jgi:CheY-like chemotaxis protein
MIGFKVLWVEDDAYQLMDMVHPLKKLDISIDTAFDYDSAKKKITSNENYDLILLDILIPSGADQYLTLEELEDKSHTKYGLELLKLIESNTKIPVIIFTVISDPQILDDIRKSDLVKDILIKGRTRPSELRNKVLEILGKQ